MRQKSERAQGGNPERVESDIRERTKTSHGIVPQPSMAWPICRATPLMDGQLLELIASNLGPIGVFIRGQFAGHLSPGQLRQLGEGALSLADDLDVDRAARSWSEEQLAAQRAKGRC